MKAKDKLSLWYGRVKVYKGVFNMGDNTVCSKHWNNNFTSTTMNKSLQVSWSSTIE